ncbi:hypothetical protein EYC84_009985 [Monilinia fructicola]|uniref:SET domain-containing protein n=1 Tax=Monilinia fructicola TaxID=38448 RepID=A0A5M9JB97_MONFR|nr:hypothetical protein EYC84_009985 [Monilinia fructicola]
MQPFRSLNAKQVESHREKLRVSTQTLKNFPHTPEHWRTRSEILLDLGFPELAAADAYKAIALINHVFDGGALRSKVWFGMGMLMWIRDMAEGISWNVDFSEADLATQMVGWLKYERKLACVFGCTLGEWLLLKQRSRYAQLLFALDHLRSFRDIKGISAEALENYPDESGFITYQRYATESYETNRKNIDDLSADSYRIPEQVVWRATEMGKILIRTYPWATNINARTEQSINAANEALAKCSKVLRIKRSTLIVPGSDDISYGLFATKDIHADEVVLENRPALAAKASQLEQHEKLLDSLVWKREMEPEGSARTAKILRRRTTTLPNVGRISHASTLPHKERNVIQGGPEISGVIWLRLLAICKQGGGHPLQSPLVANLASHEANAEDPWSLEARVIVPLEILEMLGVDIFSNQEYDAWVLETLWYVCQSLPNTSADERSTHVYPIGKNSESTLQAMKKKWNMDAGLMAHMQCLTIVAKTHQ